VRRGEGSQPPNADVFAEATTNLSRTVLFLHSSAGLYGADRQLLTLAAGLDRDRYEPVVVLPERGELAPLLEEAGVEVRLQPLAVLRRSLVSPYGAASTAARVVRDRMALSRLARRHDVALIHSNTSVVLGGGPAARRAGVPHVLHVREIYAGAAGRAGEALWPRMRSRILSADAVVCISAAVAAQFEGAPNVHLIRDCLARRPEPADRGAARAELEIEPDAFVVALIGRVSDWKGQQLLAQALAEPTLAEIGAIGLVAGDAYRGGEHVEAELAALGEQLGLGGRLRLLGFHDDVNSLLGASDAVAIPSTRPEPLGQITLEAAWAERPVVGSAHGGLPELVSDGETGLLVEPGDAAALARALRELADDRDRALAMGRAAAGAVREQVGCERMLDEVQALYERLA
jgi:glycosyltransferase involved in cell wall biosynthesis